MTAIDIVLIVAASLLFLVGVIGCIVPGLPGTPLAWGGLLVSYFCSATQISVRTLVITALVCLAAELINFFVPSFFTKKAGGSKTGAWGATIGVFVGLITASPIGILLAPFAGALIGELMYDNSNFQRALKAACFSFLGFITGTGLRIIVCACFIFIFVKSFF